MTIASLGITLVIVEDHPAIAQGLAGLLSDESDIALAGVATTVPAAEALLESERPTVALCDVMLDGALAGFDLLRRFGGSDGTAFVMFSAYDFPRFYATAVQLGATAYLLKTAAVTDILAAIRTAASGRGALPAETLRRARSAAREPTPRELEIVRLVAEGRPNKAVAESLGISLKTVESRLRHIFDRYDLHSRSELAALAMREGWLARVDRS